MIGIEEDKPVRDAADVVGSSNIGTAYPSTEVRPEARRSAITALEAGQTHYVKVAGIDPLREAVAGFLGTLGIRAVPERVIVTGGIQEARFLTLQGMIRPYADTLLARGDRKARYLAVYDVVYSQLPVAVPSVVHPGLRAAIAVRDRKVAVMPSDEGAGFLPSLDAIEGALESGSRLIYLESPSLLTGAIYEPEQVDHIGHLLEAYDALCVVDQSAAPAVDGYLSFSTVATDRVASIGQVWPGMGLDELQIGYVMAPETCVEGLVALKQVLSICTSTPAQWAAVGAGPVFREEHPHLLREMEAAYARVIADLEDSGTIVRGHAVNVIALRLGDRAVSVLEQLLEIGISATLGDAFGAPGTIRVTLEPGVDTNSALSEAVRRVS